ncbi:hypothetical protein EDB83DRAFT_2316110 [Lactarius deliciosus]|nr:hypothetical protein EDB83DRAFT_2316110 [Lactarius deliciosus]
MLIFLVMGTARAIQSLMGSDPFITDVYFMQLWTCVAEQQQRQYQPLPHNTSRRRPRYSPALYDRQDVESKHLPALGESHSTDFSRFGRGGVSQVMTQSDATASPSMGAPRTTAPVLTLKTITTQVATTPASITKTITTALVSTTKTITSTGIDDKSGHSSASIDDEGDQPGTTAVAMKATTMVAARVMAMVTKAAAGRAMTTRLLNLSTLETANPYWYRQVQKKPGVTQANHYVLSLRN